MNENTSYTLPVGEEEFIRLMGLNEIFNPYTFRFLNEFVEGLEYSNILDIGCGLGVITRELATRASKGHVLGIDISQEQIDLAVGLTNTDQFPNLKFQTLAVEDIEKLNKKFDVVYFRFVLEHMQEPYKILELIDSVLNNNAKILIEVITSYEAVFSDPDSAAFQAWKALLLKQPDLLGTDFYIGKNLRSYFKKQGYTVLEQQLCQPIMKHNESRKKFLSGIQGNKLKQLYVERGFYTEKEYDELVDAFLAFSDQDNIITAPQYTQLYVQKQS